MTDITALQLVSLIKSATDDEAAAAMLDTWKSSNAPAAAMPTPAKRTYAKRNTKQNVYWQIVRDNPGVTAMEIVTIARAAGDTKLLEMSDEAAVAWITARLRKDTRKKVNGNRVEVNGRFWFKDQWREYQNPRLKAVTE